MPENIRSFLAHVKKPSRYIGNEFNARCKNWDAAPLRIALVFPDLYEIGMSHHGLQILYGIINAQPDLLADRVYAPDTDLEEQLRQRQLPLFAVESRRPLADFDLIGITLPYELCYTNILTILNSGDIPLRAANRTESHPYVIGGGSGSFNPEPVADFFDAILLGDGEEAILEIAAVLKSAREKGLTRQKTLEEFAGIKGVYVPGFFEPQYDSSGRLSAVKQLKKNYQKVERRILPDLETLAGTGKPLVPLVRIIHDRLGIEVARGCTRGCRFCQAGIIYRPVRERSADRVMELADKGMAAGGFEELALLSLSTGDYSCLSPVLGGLMDRFVKDYVSVSMPSMRVGTLTPEIMAQIRRVRKTGFTLAPEAGTDRLRSVINKGISEDDLLQTCRDASTLGWKLLKFYFMLGLPTETAEDVMAIAELVHKAAKTSTNRSLKINVSVAAFVPKPHTPFQWEPQISINETFAKIDLLKKHLPKGNYKLKWHDPKQSFLEGVMSRGDRRLSRVIEQAWQRGARLDAWSEQFDLEMWQNAARACEIELEDYLRGRDFSEILPWQHLDTGVDLEFLKAELKRSLSGEYTQDCRVYGCQNCGVCDFEQLSPVVQLHHEADQNSKKQEGNDPDNQVETACLEQSVSAPTRPHTAGSHYCYRMIYSKQGDIRFLSHLELIQVFFQAFRRAGMKLHYTQGFNPVPKVSFSPALPVGTESLVEYLDVDLSEKIADMSRLLSKVNRQLPDGLEVKSVAEKPDKNPDAATAVRSCYTISLARQLSDKDRNGLENFMAVKEFFLTKIRKGRERKLDIRRQVESIAVSGKNRLELVVQNQEGEAAGKPAEILKAALDLSDEEVLALRIVKTESVRISCRES